MHNLLRSFAGYLGALVATFLISRLSKWILSKALRNKISSNNILFLTYTIVVVLLLLLVKDLRLLPVFLSSIVFLLLADILMLKAPKDTVSQYRLVKRLIYYSLGIALSWGVAMGIMAYTGNRSTNYDQCVSKYSKDISSEVAAQIVMRSCRNIASSSTATAAFDDCILREMRGVMNDVTARAIYKSCKDKYLTATPSDEEMLTALNHQLSQNTSPSGPPWSVVEQRPMEANDYVVEGERLYQSNNYPDALKSFYKAIELNPSSAVAYHDLAMTLLAQGDYQAAIKNFSKAIELNPKFERAYNGRAIAYEEIRNKDASAPATIVAPTANGSKLPTQASQENSTVPMQRWVDEQGNVHFSGATGE